MSYNLFSVGIYHCHRLPFSRTCDNVTKRSFKLCTSYIRNLKPRFIFRLRSLKCGIYVIQLAANACQGQNMDVLMNIRLWSTFFKSGGRYYPTVLRNVAGRNPQTGCIKVLLTMQDKWESWLPCECISAICVVPVTMHDLIHANMYLLLSKSSQPRTQLIELQIAFWWAIAFVLLKICPDISGGPLLSLS